MVHPSDFCLMRLIVSNYKCERLPSQIDNIEQNDESYNNYR